MAVKRRLGALQQRRLHVEFRAAHQVEPGQLRLQHRLEVGLEVLSQIAHASGGMASANRRARSSKAEEFMKLIAYPLEPRLDASFALR